MLRIDVWDLTKGKTLTFQSPAVCRCGPDSKRQRTPLKVRDFHITASIERALSSWSFHLLIQQKRFCPPTCRYKSLFCPKKASVAHLASLRYSTVAHSQV